MSSFEPLFPGMLLDSAARFAQEHAGADLHAADTVREMGWACTLVPEDAGGVGGTLADLGAVVEGLAAQALHLPVIETCAIAPLLLAAAAPEAAARWLEAVCEGSAVVAPLVPLSAPLDAPVLSARPLDIGHVIDGTVRGADLPPQATHVLLLARVGDGGEAAIFLAERDRLPAPAAHYRTMEGRHAADYVLGGLALPEGACLARGDAARAALARADQAALWLTAADTVAALSALVQHTVAYLKERRQFGVALSTFQALRHRTADMYVRLASARGLLLHTLAEVQRDAPDLHRTLRLAKFSLAETARGCAEAAIQLHGGMGMSEEVLATRLAQRLLASEFRWGDRLTLALSLKSSDTAAGAAPAAQPDHHRSAR